VYLKEQRTHPLFREILDNLPEPKIGEWQKGMELAEWAKASGMVEGQRILLSLLRG